MPAIVGWASASSSEARTLIPREAAACSTRPGVRLTAAAKRTLGLTPCTASTRKVPHRPSPTIARSIIDASQVEVPSRGRHLRRFAVLGRHVEPVMGVQALQTGVEGTAVPGMQLEPEPQEEPAPLDFGPILEGGARMKDRVV